jgi:hypothetical protein
MSVWGHGLPRRDPIKAPHKGPAVEGKATPVPVCLPHLEGRDLATFVRPSNFNITISLPSSEGQSHQRVMLVFCLGANCFESFLEAQIPRGQPSRVPGPGRPLWKTEGFHSCGVLQVPPLTWKWRVAGAGPGFPEHLVRRKRNKQ